MLCCGRRKDQGRDIPPNAEPAASPRRLQLGQIASTLQPSGRVGGPGPNSTNKDFPHMVLQPDFRKVSGISTEIFRQLEAVENDHDATTAAALGAVERRGEMLVRMLNPRQFSRSVQGTVQKFLNMQDALHAVHFVEIVKRPGQTLGLYIREGNGLDRYDGVFISRIAIESAVFNSGCLGVGDEILAVNLVDVTHMSLDDVVILMSIPRRLVLTIRQQKGQRIMTGGQGVGPTHSILRTESKLPPVVVMKKDLEDQDQYDDSNGENGPMHLPHQYYSAGHGQGGIINHYANLSQGIHSLGRGRGLNIMTASHPPPGGRLFSTGPGLPPGRTMIHQAPHSIQSLPRHGPYAPSYANLGLQPGLPDVAADYSRLPSRHEDFRLDAPQPPIRRPHFADYYDQMRPEPPPRPSSQQGGYMDRHDLYTGPPSTRSYDWHRSSTADRVDSHHHSHHHPASHIHHPPQPSMGPSRDGSAVTGRDMSTASVSYQPPPPVITEQPRSVVPAHFQPFDRAYPKTLESLAEKVHTFYTGPRPSRQGHGAGRSSLRMPRTGSDHRLGSRTDQQLWYGSMPRQRTADYRSLSLQQPLTPGQQAQAVSIRYSSALSARIAALPQRRKVLDYASDSEATAYTPSLRSAGLSLPASTRRSLGLTNGRSNSLPRDFIRGRGGRKQGVRFDRRGGPPDLTSSLAGRRALLLSSGIHSEDESDGAASAPEMPTPRRERGRMPSSPCVFTSAEYRAWLSRAPSTSAIYERLKTNRDSELIQTQKAAKLTFSAENLSLLDRARNRVERYAKILTEPSSSAVVDRDNQSDIAMWEARLRTQEQPYYSYRSHLMNTGLTGGDSTLARALAGARASSSALTALGIGQSPLRESSSGPGTGKDQIGTPTDPMRRLGLTPSRSRDLISPFSSTAAASGVVSTTSTGITIDPTGGRTTPSSFLRMSDKETDSIRKEILSRSILTRDMLPRDRDTLKEELEEKAEKIASRLAHVTTSVSHPGAPQSILRTSGQLSSSTSATSSTSLPDSRLKLLTINPSEFLRYKIERPSSAASDVTATTNGINGGPQGHSGILRVHLLAGRALRSTVRSTDSTIRTRDLYCVLECDRVHKARTVVCTGDQNFDWDEVFELDLINNKELDFLIYSWDPQLRHRLCYKGSVNLLQVLNDPPGPNGTHQLAIKVEPRGTLYVKLKHTPPQEAFKRELRSGCLFGGDVDSVVIKEDSGLNVPLIVQRCIEEIERRGLDIIGLYRLCGSATKKQTLREAFERSPRIVDLSAENVPDINVIAGVLKDYLREMPEPLLTKCLYQMLVDALGVCLPDDPEGNARLLFSIIECLPKPNRCTLLLILEHLSLVCSLSDRNKMGPVQLAGSFGPILMIHFDGTGESLDFAPPVKILQYLLEVWPAKSVTLLQTVRAVGAEAVRKGPTLLAQGRQPFPRSSPTSILSSRSQKTHLSKTSLHLSPSKASPGSLSESSPSPTSVHSTNNNAGPTAITTTTTSMASSLTKATTSITTSTTNTVTTSSSSSGVLTLTPSTTSSSLTSVTTPNSLTPVSATAKSIPPATTSSNYSLTSEFSTTSITSPTPGMKGSDTNEELFATVSVRSRVSAFEQSTTTTTTPAGRTVENVDNISILTTATMSSTISYPPASANEEMSAGQQLFSSQPSTQFQPYQPPQYPSQQLTAQQQQLYQQYQAHQQYQQAQQQQLAQQQYQQAQQQQAQQQYQQAQQQQQAEQQYQQAQQQYQQQQAQQQYQQYQQQQAQQQYQQLQQAHQQQFQEEQERQEAEQAQKQKPQPPAVPPSPFMGRKLPAGPGRVERAESLDERGSIKRKLPPLPPSFSHPDMPAPQGGGQYSEQPSNRLEQRSHSLDQPTEARKAAVPPPPPPKPSASRMRRELMDEQSPSQSQEDESPEMQQDSSDSRRSSVGDVQPGRHGNNINSSNHNNNTWSSPVTSSSTSTPTTVQSQGNSKGSSPGPATPLSTPPPVPPRLDRRPSQPSPTSSPPSMPPPVPPRLGRAAPVRTPSLDGRDAFEVDCYTIKEENGEEDYLT